MKTDKRGMLWVDRVGARRSYAILARNFWVENEAQVQNEKTLKYKNRLRGLLILAFPP